MTLRQLDHPNEPGRGVLGGFRQDGLWICPSDFCDFGRFWDRFRVDHPDEHVVELVFHEARVRAPGAIDQRTNVNERAFDPELFANARLCRCDEVIPGARVAAARVRPHSGKVVFRERAAL